jgi:DNA protecting protein DprA
MDTQPLPSAERDALLALWAVPGIGSIGLGGMRRWAAGRWADLLETPARDWVDGFPASDLVRARIRAAGSLRAVADEVRERAARGQMEVLHRGDSGYPERLAEVRDAPPVLFVRGVVGRPRRRLALVGTRHPEQGYLRHARAFAAAVAGAGAGVVSGAAAGVDRSCHLGALDVGAETWAFLGSALDALDPAQARLVPLILDGGGAVFSELPPGIRASKQTFPRRNRLISGASDAVVVLRAGRRSGTMHTVAAARDRAGRSSPVRARPGRRPHWAATCWWRVGSLDSASSLRMRSVPWGWTGLHPSAATRSHGRCPGCLRRRRQSMRCSTGSRERWRSWRNARGWIRAER